MLSFEKNISFNNLFYGLSIETYCLTVTCLNLNFPVAHFICVLSVYCIITKLKFPVSKNKSVGLFVCLTLQLHVTYIYQVPKSLSYHHRKLKEKSFVNQSIALLVQVTVCNVYQQEKRTRRFDVASIEQRTGS